jgi:uncharacterized membrane protein YphA (DoxX/SURF4 family)
MAYEQITLLLGRILIGGYFAFSGINHFMKKDQLSGWSASRGVPMPDLAVLGSGVLLVAGGLSIAAGAYTALGVAMIGLFLLVATPWMHNFWDMEGEDKQNHMINFLKNIGLLGGLLVVLSIALGDGITAYSIGLSLI